MHSAATPGRAGERVYGLATHARASLVTCEMGEFRGRSGAGLLFYFRIFAMRVSTTGVLLLLVAYITSVVAVRELWPIIGGQGNRVSCHLLIDTPIHSNHSFGQRHEPDSAVAQFPVQHIFYPFRNPSC